MAAQGMDVHHGEASPSSPRGNSFVKSIDRKARSYLKTLERSFSFSITESKGEDPQTMTIEFLRARLQAQRAEYKAEKQRSQLLAKKVLELEQRLSFEVEQRRKAMCNNMQLISPNYRSIPPSRLKDTPSYSERGLALINSKLKENSSGEDDPSDWCSEISESEAQLDRDGVFLISPSSLRHHWESLRREHQQRADQHVISLVNEGINAASVLDKESFTLHHKELRDMPCEATSCAEYALSMEGLKAIADQESTKFHAITTDCKQESSTEAWNIAYGTDPQSWRVSNTFDTPALVHEKPSEAGRCMHATKATTYHPNNYLARSIDSCQNYQLKFSGDPINPVDIMVAPKLSPRREVHVKDFHPSLEANAERPRFGSMKSTSLPHLSRSMSAGHDRILEYIVSHTNTINEIQEERASLRQSSNLESKRKNVKEIYSPECLNDYEMRALGQSPQKLFMQKTKATFNTRRSFSVVETRYRRKLHGHRMSLDGGLDRLQKVGKEICSS